MNPPAGKNILRAIVSRTKHRRPGYYYILELECGHSRKCNASKAGINTQKRVHCQKCLDGE